MMIENKIIECSELAPVIAGLKQEGKRVVFTNGCFDLLHVGHIRYLRAAREEGDLLVLGLNSDRSVWELKGENRPLIPQERIVTSESGIKNRGDLEKLKGWGVNAVLVGEALVTAGDILAKMRELIL